MQWHPWLNEPYRQILHRHQAGRGHHALLIQAADGMGAESLVWGISRWLMCHQPEGLKSCGHCHGCHLMQAGNHPDWYRLEAEKGKRTLTIDLIRQTCERLYHHAQQGGAKVIWLPDASQLNEASANALLKTVEEPPANTWFFFCCDEPSRLPATLRSRCQLQHLPPPPESTGVAWLQKNAVSDINSATTALRLSGGVPPAALSLLNNDSWKQRQQLCDILFDALRHDPLLLLTSLDHDNVAERINWICTLLIDALKHQYHAGGFITNIDRRQLVQQLAEWLPAAALEQSFSQWITCRDRLLRVVAVNRELLLTEQLLSWEKIVRPV